MTAMGDRATRDTTPGVHVADLGPGTCCPRDRVQVTFYWSEAERWEEAALLVCIE